MRRPCAAWSSSSPARIPAAPTSPTNRKIYIVWNSTAEDVTFNTVAGTGIPVGAGAVLILYCDATNIIQLAGLVATIDNIGDVVITAPASGALAMPCPADAYVASPRPYCGLPELTYPLHDRDVLVTTCGRICLHRKKINLSTVLAGQRLGIKEVDDGIWIVSFMRYDLGFIDLEQRTLQLLDNPCGLGAVAHVLGTFRYYVSAPDRSVVAEGEELWSNHLCVIFQSLSITQSDELVRNRGFSKVPQAGPVHGLENPKLCCGGLHPLMPCDAPSPRARHKHLAT
jgi:hypothetical protein